MTFIESLQHVAACPRCPSCALSAGHFCDLVKRSLARGDLEADVVSSLLEHVDEFAHCPNCPICRDVMRDAIAAATARPSLEATP